MVLSATVLLGTVVKYWKCTVLFDFNVKVLYIYIFFLLRLSAIVSVEDMWCCFRPNSCWSNQRYPDEDAAWY